MDTEEKDTTAVDGSGETESKKTPKKMPKKEKSKTKIPVVSDDESALAKEEKPAEEVEEPAAEDEKKQPQEDTSSEDQPKDAEQKTDEPEESPSESPETVEDIEQTEAKEKPDNESEVVDEASDSLDPNDTLEEAMAKAEDAEGTKTDAEIEAAVDDIVRSESDEIIEKADEETATAPPQQTEKSFKQKIAGFFMAWWRNKKARYGSLAGLLVLIIILALIPGTRYGVLNLAGVRVSSSMTVIDSQTRLPLKNINVSLQGKEVATDEEGFASFSNLKLGNSELSITKRGYADNTRSIVLGWGSNPIGDQELLATGEQFTFVLSDWLSSEAITEAEATAGENSAQADADGKIILTVGEENIASVEVMISADDYRSETLSGDALNQEEIPVQLVPSKKHVFVSTRSGDYDLYKIDLDKQNEEILLSATGKEREVPRVIQHPSRDVAAFVSSREGDVNSDGFILEGLYMVNVESGESERIARSEQLQVLGWSDDYIVFWQVVEGTSRGNPERSKLISYNYVTGERIDLAAANYFNDVELVGDQVYYAVSSFAVPQSQAKLYSVQANGQNKTTIVDSQVWNIFRTNYDTLLFSAVNQKWFEKVGDSELTELSQQQTPSSLRFVDSADHTKTAWVEVRDGKGVLLSSDVMPLEEQQILTQSGLSQVLYWANPSTVIYRVISNDETADYVINLDGGEAQKISDVTAFRNTYF